MTSSIMQTSDDVGSNSDTNPETNPGAINPLSETYEAEGDAILLRAQGCFADAAMAWGKAQGLAWIQFVTVDAPSDYYTSDNVLHGSTTISNNSESRQLQRRTDAAVSLARCAIEQGVDEAAAGEHLKAIQAFEWAVKFRTNPESSVWFPPPSATIARSVRSGIVEQESEDDMRGNDENGMSGLLNTFADTCESIGCIHTASGLREWAKEEENELREMDREINAIACAPGMQASSNSKVILVGDPESQLPDFGGDVVNKKSSKRTNSESDFTFTELAAASANSDAKCMSSNAIVVGDASGKLVYSPNKLREMDMNEDKQNDMREKKALIGKQVQATPTDEGRNNTNYTYSVAELRYIKDNTRIHKVTYSVKQLKAMNPDPQPPVASQHTERTKKKNKKKNKKEIKKENKSVGAKVEERPTGKIEYSIRQLRAYRDGENNPITGSKTTKEEQEEEQLQLKRQKEEEEELQRTRQAKEKFQLENEIETERVNRLLGGGTVAASEAHLSDMLAAFKMPV